MFFSSFKDNREILTGIGLFPKRFSLDGYRLGVKSDWQYGFRVFMINSFKLVIPTVLFSVVSTSLVAYGFARFRFPLRKAFFAVMLSTLMLPNTVLILSLIHI